MDCEIYVAKVVEAIDKEILFRFENLNKTIKKYIYLFKIHGIPNHPTLPYSIVKDKKNFYMNDYINIYPVNEIMKALQIKFPKYSIRLTTEKDGIIIDWN